MENRCISVPAYNPTDEMHERGLHEVSRAVGLGCHSRDQLYKVYYEGCLMAVDDGLSDLEIVQRALERMDAQLVWVGDYASVIAQGKTMIDGGIQDVLTWAKQTIGVE